MTKPQVIVLDEPTTGLDPQGRNRVWQELETMKQAGVTILMSTHYMDEASALCDRLAIMHDGRILAEGAPDELVSQHAGQEVAQVRVSNGARGDVVEWIGSAGLDYRDAGAVITVTSPSGGRPDLSGLEGVRVSYRPSNPGGRVPVGGGQGADGRMMGVAQSTYIGGIRPRSIAGIWFRHALVLRHTWLPSLTWYFVEPVVILLAIGVGIGTLVDDIDGLPYARFVTPGVIAGSAMFHAIFECSWGSFFRIQKGVYETTLTAPVSTRELAMGDISWAMSRAIITATCIGLVATALGWIDSLSGAGVLLSGRAGGHPVRRAGPGIRRARAEHPHPVAQLHGGGVAALLLQRGVLPHLGPAGLAGADSLGHAAHAIRAPGAGIPDRQPGHVAPAVGPLRDRHERGAYTRSLRAAAPPTGQVEPVAWGLRQRAVTGGRETAH